MRHSEVAETPRQCGCNRQNAVAPRFACRNIMSLKQVQVAVKLRNICKHTVKSVCTGRAEAHHHKQRNRHNNALNKVGRGSGKKASQSTVHYDYRGAQQHCLHIFHSEQRGKQLSASRKAGGCIRNKEYYYNNCGNCCKDSFVISEAFAEEIRQGERVDTVGVYAKLFCNKKPVEISSDGETDCCPCGFRKTAHQGNRGKSHKQPAAHIRSFRAESGHQRPQPSPPEVKIVCFFVFS